MADVTEVSNFDAGVYQLEITDPLEGGSVGILNKAIKNLANRTKWLKDQLDTLKFLFFLRKGTVSVGNIVIDKIITVSFASIGTSSYLVAGSLVSLSSNYNDDNDVIWMIKDKTSTSFKICLRNVGENNPSLNFDYVLIPF